MTSGFGSIGGYQTKFIIKGLESNETTFPYNSNFSSQCLLTLQSVFACFRKVKQKSKPNLSILKGVVSQEKHSLIPFLFPVRYTEKCRQQQASVLTERLCSDSWAAADLKGTNIPVLPHFVEERRKTMCITMFTQEITINTNVKLCSMG